jgi:hypothetical protein
MTDNKAMKLALDALENIDDAMPFPVGKSAIKALEEALAKQEQEQEPVAWISPSGALYRTRYHAVANAEQSLTPLYLHPPQRTEPICPECKAEVLYECVACSSNNYPPQRPWVGLTDEELHEACWESYVDPVTGECSTGDREYAVRWTEAKLKEKNT